MQNTNPRIAPCPSAALAWVEMARWQTPGLSHEERFADIFADARREAHDRARLLADRIYPYGPSAHGFYQPAAFFERAYIRGKNRHFFNRAYERLLDAIIRRDSLLPQDSYVSAWDYRSIAKDRALDAMVSA